MEPFSELGNTAGTVTTPPVPTPQLAAHRSPGASQHPDSTLTAALPFSCTMLVQLGVPGPKVTECLLSRPQT